MPLAARFINLIGYLGAEVQSLGSAKQLIVKWISSFPGKWGGVTPLIGCWRFKSFAFIRDTFAAVPHLFDRSQQVIGES